jgi:multidrug efflux pump subunit AcrA (membrane-fusion protein)
MATRKVVTGVVTLGIAALAGLSIFRALTAGPGDVPRPSTVENAQRRAAPTESAKDFRQPLGAATGITGQGIVEPADREVKVGSRVPGLVQKILVKEGDQISQGALLLELASDAERAAVSAAKADLDAAVARSATSSATARRVEQLAGEGLISRDERDRSVNQASVDRAGVEQARSRLSEAQARLSQLMVKAPSAGTILKLSVREGEYYSPEGGASLVTLGNLSKVRVRLDIDERFIGSVFVGQPGYVMVEAYDRKFPGKVVEIAQRMGRKNQRTDDPTERIDTKIREVVVELEDARELVPGLRATGYLSETKLESSSKVARSKGALGPPAVVESSGGSVLLAATASVTTGARPATAEEWDRRGAALLSAGNHREAVAVYREAVMAHPDLRTRIKDLAGQYRQANLELAYCLDPSDKALAAAWSTAGGPRHALCAESR